MKQHWLIQLFLVLLMASSPALVVQAQDDLFGDGGDGAAAEPAEEPTGGAVDGGDPFLGGFGQPEPPPGPTADEQAQIDQLNASAASKAASGDLDGAAADYEAASEIAPSFQSFFELGRIKRQQEEPAEAAGYFQSALREAGTVEDQNLVARAYQELGQSYIDLERYNDAIQVFQIGLSAVAGQARNPDLLYGMGKAQAEFAMNQQFVAAQTRQEDLQKALEFFDGAIKARPEFPEALFERGETHSLLGDSDKAVEDLDKAVQLDGNNSEYAAKLGFALLRRALTESSKRKGERTKILEDLNATTQNLTRFLQLEPEDIPEEELEDDDIRRETVLIQRSIANLAIGDESTNGATHYRAALADARAALEIEPQLADGFFQAGMALRMLDDLPGAKRAFNEALEINPRNGSALLRRGIVNFRMGDLQLAKEDLRGALAAGPNPIVNFWLGLVYSKLDQPEQAVEQYSTAIRYYPYYTMAHFNRGLMYMKLGRYERVVDDMNKVLQRQNNHAQARSVRDQALQFAAQERRPG